MCHSNWIMIMSVTLKQSDPVSNLTYSVGPTICLAHYDVLLGKHFPLA